MKVEPLWSLTVETTGTTFMLKHQHTAHCSKIYKFKTLPNPTTIINFILCNKCFLFLFISSININIQLVLVHFHVFFICLQQCLKIIVLK